MGNKKILGLVAGLVVLGSLVSLFLSCYGLPPDLDRRPPRALGQRLAREALKLGGAGTKVILITRDTSLFTNPFLDELQEGFLSTLRQGGGQLTLTHAIKVDPLRVTAVPPGDFLQILKKASTSEVVVSLLGPPVLTDGQADTFSGKAPRLVALCSGQMEDRLSLKKVFAQGLMQVAVVDKKSATRGGPGGDGLEAWFDHFYAVVTPESPAEPVPASN